MPISVTCPSCGKTANAPDSFAGQIAKCVKCGTRIQVPNAEPSPLPEARPVHPGRLQVDVVGISIPMGDAINLIVTFWVASFAIGVAIGLVLLAVMMVARLVI